jgi:hypothetical protein
MFFRLFLLSMFAVCLFSQKVLAEIATRAPDARQWVESLNQSDIDALVAPTSLVLLESLGDAGSKTSSPTFKKFNHKLCKQLSFFLCTSSRDAAFSALLNCKGMTSGISSVFAISPANAAVVASGEKIMLYGKPLSAPIEVEMEKADFSKLNLRVLTDKILTSVAYDAVVLAAKDDYLLVGSTELRLKRPNIQGLIVASSSDKWTLSGVNSKGAGLLSLVSRSGGFGVFQLVLQGDSVGSTVPLGTKVLIENIKKKNP